jgi:hypothetical protein
VIKKTLFALALVAGCKEGAPPPGNPPQPTASTAPSPPATVDPPPSAGPSTGAPSADAAAVLTPAETPPGTTTWNFDADKVNAPPAGFTFGRTGQGKEGRWLVQAAADAPSNPNVLAQLDADPTDYRFPVAVAEGPLLRDVRLSVSCKSISGKVDQGCGLVWRYRDAGNYYLTRANALEDSVNLYHVKGGQRRPFASWSGKVAKNTWHKLRVDAKGDRFEVYFDDQKVLGANDSTFPDPGKVGVWTKADSVIEFDDLSASPL